MDDFLGLGNVGFVVWSVDHVEKHVKNPVMSGGESRGIPAARPPDTSALLALDWRTVESLHLSRELQTYVSALDRLLSQKDDYVLIKGDDVVGTYPTRELAVMEAIDRFGSEPVLIKRIAAIEPVLEVGHVFL